MSLIKATRKLHNSSVEELWFGMPIEHNKLQQWIADLISWSIYCRYKNLNWNSEALRIVLQHPSINVFQLQSARAETVKMLFVPLNR
jgi:hypothetical protein